MSGPRRSARSAAKKKAVQEEEEANVDAMEVDAHPAPAPAAAPPAPAPSAAKKEKSQVKAKAKAKAKGARQSHGSGSAPTVEQIVEDPLTQLALQYWSSGTKHKPYDAAIVEQIYNEELEGSTNGSGNDGSVRKGRVVMLELGRYLENYLWPNFTADSSNAHLLSIFILINQKFVEGVDAWAAFDDEAKFSLFFEKALELRASPTLTMRQRTVFTVFLINAFQSFGNELVRAECMRVTSLLTWHAVSEGRREAMFNEVPKLRKVWKFLNKKRTGKKKQGTKAVAGDRPLDAAFFPALVTDFLSALEGLHLGDVGASRATITYLERSVELFTDILSQLTTRRFLGVVLEDLRLLVRARRSELYRVSAGKLFHKLLDIHAFYARFEIDDFTGEALGDEVMEVMHYKRMKQLQQIAFRDFGDDLRDFALSNVQRVDTKETLLRHLAPLSTEKLQALCKSVNVPVSEEKELMLESMVSVYERRQSQLQLLNKSPLFPDEELLWDPDQVPSSNRISDTCLALPKLNIQFLTFHDYFLRNFNLFRLESTYEIRQSLEDAVKRLQANSTLRGDGVIDVNFGGWARNAVRIQNLTVVDVQPPHVGFTVPSKVVAEVKFALPQPNLNLRDQIQREWDSLREHDSVFLLALQPKNQRELKAMTQEQLDALTFPERYGVLSVRGATVASLHDAEGQTLSDPNPNTKPKRAQGSGRTVKLELDPAQYQLDLDNSPEGSEFPSTLPALNVILKRKAKENNFKSVLETIRDLMNLDVKVPDWLHDVFLGYGDPQAAANTSVISQLDFHDTFVSADHVTQSFPGRDVQFVGEQRSPPYKLSFPEDEKKPIEVTAYVPPPPGPYPQDLPKRNTVPFTPIQVESIKRSMNEGLTLIVGPPGTGKTDVAVQVISNLYHTFPNQRTLIVTHSNQALNQIFEKLAALEIDSRHLLRLGHGATDIISVENADYSKFGRVNFMLRLRLQLLEQVAKLATTLDIPVDVAYTAETSANFFTYHVLSRWEKFLEGAKAAQEANLLNYVSQNFPFTAFFADVDGLFSRSSVTEDLKYATGCWNHISHIFTRLADCRAFELLKSWTDRGNYLLMSQAKIVAMTCTHAALKRRQLLEFGFKYDNIIMEESAQILEIETFIPMLLQNQDPEAPSRLKRVVLIGDHNQLPPVIQNQAIQTYSKLDQSLFTRFIRLGVPYLQLDHQGRARSSIASLYSWRYQNLANLPHVESRAEFQLANPGFLYDYQLINVEDYMGRGEMTPSAFFYQNLGEAEYVVATFMFMRMMGYPAEKITILTSYNGQKHLIRDVINQRCAHNPRYGRPHKVTTVDRYQGQQNDYVLLSLVRTRSVGHIRDVRRLVVAMSRARLGLYVFCRKALFENCYELTPTFSKLRLRPDKLQLVQNETYPGSRKVTDTPTTFEVADLTHMGRIVGSAM